MSQIKESNKTYWKSIEDKNNSDQIKSLIENEFPEGTVELAETITRKKFLSLMGASMAMAGLVGCRKPVQKILPYIQAPEEIIPGIPNYYATTMPFGMNSFGVVVESHEGRPTHIEGNNLHSSSKGAVNSFIQASILDLYDPDRMKKTLNSSGSSSLDNFKTYVKEVSGIFKENKGEGLAVISSSFRSNTTKKLYNKFNSNYPKSKWIAFDLVSNENQIKGLEDIMGEKVLPIYHFDKVDIVLSLESDFIGSDLNSIHNQKTFSEKRRVKNKNDKMNRLYAVESNLSTTGMMADHRFKIKPSEIYNFVAELNNMLLNYGLSGLKKINSNKMDSKSKKFISVLAQDLIKNKSKSIITVGEDLDSSIHSLVYFINESLSKNNNITYHSVADGVSSDSKSMINLIDSIKSNEIDTLLVFDLDFYHLFSHYFDKEISSLVNIVYLGSHNDMTAANAYWSIPKSHYLESWGDAISIDGTLSIIQPLIAPLYDSISINEMISLFINEDKTDYDILRENWQSDILKTNFSSKWRRAIHDGYLEGTENSNIVSAKKNIFKNLYNRFNKNIGNLKEEEIEIRFCSSNQIHDGRYINNYWLREVSDPITKVSWENVALISYSMAEKYHIKNSDIITINYNNQSLDIAAWTLPGLPDNTIILEMGYGREINREVDRNYIDEDVLGVNVLPLKDTFKNFVVGGSLKKTERTQIVACTQDHHGLDLEKLAGGEVENRLPEIIRESNIEDFKKNDDFVLDYDRKWHLPDEDKDMPSMYPAHDYSEGPQWGMSIDLNVCSGCNACAIACQSENNIPVVGKEQVYKGREMSWIRMDRYFKGDVDNPEFALQPVACVHCENAPCEQVCPVAATVHDEEGLNGMTYNRCIGTRYCANNCPYKVRRFNFYNYTYDTPEVVQMSHNPDVTVRFRGVMEKCSYCVQRISEAKITAKNEKRALIDGDVKVACQSSCGMGAIEFGDITDSNSRVSKAKALSHDYSLLRMLNTKPRTTYLAKFRNPHPDLVEASDKNEKISVGHH